MLRELGEASPWREEVEEYTGHDVDGFQERHYNEFVSFLPYVQRFLYGEGRSRKQADGRPGMECNSPMRTFRRGDIAAVQLVARPGDAPVTLSVADCDLYFFYDVDVGKCTPVVNPKHISMGDTVAVMTGAISADDLPQGVHA